MKQKKMWFAVMVLFVLSLCLTGCKDKGAAFVGRWVQVEVKEGKKPSSLDIELDDGVFHVNYSWHVTFVIQEGDETLRTKKLEAKAESENVLSVIAPLNQTMRLNENVISFDNKEFKKIN